MKRQKFKNKTAQNANSVKNQNSDNRQCLNLNFTELTNERIQNSLKTHFFPFLFYNCGPTFY